MEVQKIPNYAKFTCFMHLKGNKHIYINASFLHNLIILFYEENITNLCNEFHIVTPIIVVENCYVPVLANVTKIVFILLFDDIENLLRNAKGNNSRRTLYIKCNMNKLSNIINNSIIHIQ